MTSKIVTATQLHQAEIATYMTDAIVGIAFVILILIVANIIKWQPGTHDTSPAKRRIWFWILGVACLFTSLGIDYTTWMTRIDKAKFVSEYTIHMIAAAVAGVILYGLVTFMICKFQKKDTKLASMF